MTTRRFSLLLCVAALSAPACAEELGRLFFSPQERFELDRRGASPPAAAAPADHRGPESIRLDGIVRREDGKTTVWINGHAAAPSEAARLSGSAAAVTLPGGHRVRLKVGDVAPLPTTDDTAPGGKQ